MCQESESDLTLIVCGSNCEHEFGEELVPIVQDGREVGGTTVCKKCGMTAFAASQWSGE